MSIRVRPLITYDLAADPAFSGAKMTKMSDRNEKVDKYFCEKFIHNFSGIDIIHTETQYPIIQRLIEERAKIKHIEDYRDLDVLIVCDGVWYLNAMRDRLALYFFDKIVVNQSDYKIK